MAALGPPGVDEGYKRNQLRSECIAMSKKPAAGHAVACYVHNAVAGLLLLSRSDFRHKYHDASVHLDSSNCANVASSVL